MKLAVPPKIKLNIIQERPTDPSINNDSIFKTLEGFAKVKNIKLLNNVNNEFSYKVEGMNECDNCFREDCNTSKIMVSGNYIITYCKYSNTEKTVGTIPIDENILTTLNFEQIKRNILNKISKYVESEDNGIVALIKDNLSEIVRVKGNFIYIYNGTTKLWTICNNSDYAGHIISLYLDKILSEIILLVTNYLNNGETKKEGELDTCKNIINLLNVIHKKIKKLPKMGKIMRIASNHFIPMDDISGFEYYFPIKDCKVVDLRNGEILERRNDHYFFTESKCMYLGVDYQCPNMEKFMKSLFDNEDEINFMQELMGYCLSGSINDRAYYIFWGEGRNGKSVLLEIMSHIMGSLSCTLMASTLIGKNTGATPELIQLIGVRLAGISELGKGDKLNVPLMKRLTSTEDTITGRPLYGTPIEFKNKAKLIMATNKPPSIDYDKAIVDRTRFIPFNHRFVSRKEYNSAENKENLYLKDDKFIEDLKIKYIDEVFTYFVNGAIRYFKRGDFLFPKSFEKESEEFMNENDNLKKFLDEHYIYKPDSMIRSKDVLENYNNWAMKSGYEQMNAWSMKKALISKGFTYKNTKYKRVNGVYVVGIDVKPYEDIVNI